MKKTIHMVNHIINKLEKIYPTPLLIYHTNLYVILVFFINLNQDTLLKVEEMIAKVK